MKGAKAEMEEQSDKVKAGQGELKFEEALARLEVVAQLERGELSLEDSMAEFEGMKLNKLCQTKQEAEQKIEADSQGGRKPGMRPA